MVVLGWGAAGLGDLGRDRLGGRDTAPGGTMSTRALPHAAIATILLCLATMGYMVYIADFSRFFAGTYDFLPRYTQARMVGTGPHFGDEGGRPGAARGGG